LYFLTCVADSCFSLIRFKSWRLSDWITVKTYTFVVMKRLVFFLIVIETALELYAQRRLTFLDMDTHLTIPNVTVRVKDRVYYSNAAGRVTVDSLADTVMFSHVRYLPEKLRSYEVRDTVFLLPTDHVLPEVVVDELNPQLKGLVDSWAKAGAMMGAAEAPRGLVNFDFGMMLDKRKRRDKKHLDRAKEILDKWDEADMYKKK